MPPTASGDRGLSVWVRGREADLVVCVGRPNQTVADLAEEAIHRAGGHWSAGLGRAHAARAIVAARCGDARAAHTALACAAEVAEQGVTGYVGGWGEKHQLWTEGYVRVLVGDSPERALQQALARYPPGTLGPVTNLHLMTALNLVKAREISEGLDHAITSLKLGDPGGSMRRVLTGQILDALPNAARALPAVGELRALTSGSPPSGLT